MVYLVEEGVASTVDAGVEEREGVSVLDDLDSNLAAIQPVHCSQ